MVGSAAASAVAVLLATVAGGSGAEGRRGLDRSALPRASEIVPLHALTDPGTAPVASLAPPPGDQVIAPPPAFFDAPPAPTAPAPALLRNTAPAASGGVVAAMIGINDYPGTSADLNSAVADAEDLNLALHSFGVPAAQRLMVRDTEASAATIERAVEWLVERSTPESTVVFFYAGHVRKLDSDTEAMIGADGRPVTDRELTEALAPLQARNVWVVIAGCYGGGFTEVLQPGRILTAAADANSLAYENSTFGRSYLVEYLVRRAWLKRYAGASVQEAYAYADAALRRDYPDRLPVQFDQSGGLVTFTGTPYEPVPEPPPSSAPAGEPGGPSPPPDPPCQRTLLVICKK